MPHPHPPSSFHPNVTPFLPHNVTPSEIPGPVNLTPDATRRMRRNGAGPTRPTLPRYGAWPVSLTITSATTPTTTTAAVADDLPPPYSLLPAENEFRVARILQMAEGPRLVGTPAELQAQRESLEVRYTVPEGEIDIEEALAREPCRGSRRAQRARDAQRPEPVPRMMTARERRSDFEHRRTMCLWMARQLQGVQGMGEARDAVPRGEERSRRRVAFGDCPRPERDVCERGDESQGTACS